MAKFWLSKSFFYVKKVRIFLKKNFIEEYQFKRNFFCKKHFLLTSIFKPLYYYNDAQFLTNHHLMETQNLVISFDYSWFLAKNLAYAEGLIMKFHYRNSSTVHSISAREARKDSNVPQLRASCLNIIIYTVVLTTEKHCAAKHFLQPKAGFWCKIEQNSLRVSGTCRLLCFWSIMWSNPFKFELFYTYTFERQLIEF